LFGGGEGGLGGKIADIIDKRVPDRDLATKLAHDVTVLVTTKEHEAKQAAVEAEQRFEEEVTKRAQADAASGDPYTQRTRPMIARQSWYAGCGYIAVSVVSKLASPYLPTEILEQGVLVLRPGPVVELDWGILMAIYSPALTYMGVRSFDKWKRQP
jgi:hypothetical protein